MKAKLLFPVVALIAVTNTFSAEAEVVPINIVREPTPPGSEVLHRAPAQVPISCFLEDDSYVVVNFFADLGTVSVDHRRQLPGNGQCSGGPDDPSDIGYLRSLENHFYIG